jgi:1-acyl-sn-glycerol-3-phosphate acyltransferase
MKTIARFILRTLLGWKVENGFPQEPKKYVVIAAPHTSWLDFPIAMLSRISEGTMVHFVGKSSLFRWPFGYFFKALGGMPVDRNKSNNLVEAIIAVFNSKKEFRLALSPEGTRKKVIQWKTGFYYIAKGANVPIVMATLDFKHKKVKISEPYYMTDNMEKDFKNLRNFFKDVIGKNAKLS